jgi:ubiquinone/menaquinone biosynthesis C-methylase UbiE
MRRAFVQSTLERLVEDKVLAPSDSILVVCGGDAECVLFVEMEFPNVVISNLDERMLSDQFAPLDWSFQDAQDLTYEDASFDFVFVSDGLHHCASPHRALLEMYRVARKGIIVFESRDSLLMHTANRLGLSPEYELEAVINNDFCYGGVDNTQIPNFIYRWTEQDFEKTIKSFDPVGKQKFRYFYGVNLPYETATYKKTRLKYYAIKIADPFLKLFTRLFKKQCNSFAMVALKPQVPDDLWPWLAVEDEAIVFQRAYAQKHFKVNEQTPSD